MIKNWKRRKDLEDSKNQLIVFTKGKTGIFLDKDKSKFKLEVMDDETVIYERWFKFKTIAFKEMKKYMKKH